MTTLKVVVVRTGGFAGVRRRGEVDDPEEAERVAEAVRRSAERAAAGGARDDFSYEIQIVTTTETTTIELAGAQVTQDLRPRLRAALDAGSG